MFLRTVDRSERAVSSAAIRARYRKLVRAPYHGQRSASGEIYDQEKLTAAHRTLPFGTRVRVRRLDRGGSVVVRINDRGPFVKSRIIDLSHAAAARLGITGDGVAPVTLELVDTPPVDPQNSFSVTSSRKGDRVRASQTNRVVVKHLTVLDTPIAAQ